MELDHRGFLDQLPDAVIVASRSGMIRYWNAAAERIFGFAAVEVLGGSLDLIIPESLRTAHWRGFDRALDTGETKFTGQALPTKALHRDGHEFYVELSFSLVRRDGVPEGAIACARDITARFQQDRDARRRLRALEAELDQLRGQPALGAPSTSG